MSVHARMQHAMGQQPAGLDPVVHVVLVEPQIPANTGNIARTCAATGASLHVVGTPGFSLADADLRRAGITYWPSVDLHWHPGLDELAAVLGPCAWFFFTAHATRGLHDVSVPRGSALVFGREDRGLPPDLVQARAADCVALPMRASVRSLNLSTCAGIAVFEAVRQVATSPV